MGVHLPDDGPEQQQVQQQDQRPVPAHVPVDERQRELREDSGKHHEEEGEPHPDDVSRFVVHADQHRRGHELRAVEQGGQNHADGGMDLTLVLPHRGVPIRVGDLPVLLLRGYSAHAGSDTSLFGGPREEF